jgi:hypothetical protein
MLSVRLSETTPRGRALNTDRSQPRGRGHAGLGFNNGAPHHAGRELWPGSRRWVAAAVGSWSSSGVRWGGGRGVGDGRRHMHRRSSLIDRGCNSGPVSEVPRHTFHTDAARLLGSGQSASNATALVSAEIVRPGRARHRGGRRGWSAGGQVSQGHETRQSSNALQRPRATRVRGRFKRSRGARR